MGFNAESRSRSGFWGAGGNAPRYKFLSAPLRLCVKNPQLILFIALVLPAPYARAENAYTNHAGNAIVGWPVKLTSTQVMLAECGTNNLAPSIRYQAPGTTYPLSIFPELEQRRIAADYVLGNPGTGVAALRVPAAVKRAIAGAEKAMARSRKRAEKGLCTQEESDAFCAESESALKSYLDKKVKEGAITPAERKVLGR